MHQCLSLWRVECVCGLAARTESIRPGICNRNRRIENITAVVAHELVHFQQKTSQKKSLLGDVLIEGSTDFIRELASGPQSNPSAFAFGESHQEEIWRRFEKDMGGTDDGNWIANGGSDRVRGGRSGLLRWS
jgi:hypothetical protein